LGEKYLNLPIAFQPSRRTPVTLTKIQIIEAIAEQNGYRKLNSTDIVDPGCKLSDEPLNPVKMFFSLALANFVSKRKKNEEAGPR